MAHRMFLSAIAAHTALDSTSEQSSALPVGTTNVTACTDYALVSSHAPHTGEVTGSARTTLAQTAQQSGNFASRFVATLHAQTIAAQNWDLSIYFSESATSANAFMRVSLYVYRNGTGVIGYIYDGAADLGTEFNLVPALETAQVAGSAVTAAENDLLVLEVWYVATQGNATARTVTLFLQNSSNLQSYLQATNIIKIKNHRVLGQWASFGGEQGLYGKTTESSTAFPVHTNYGSGALGRNAFTDTGTDWGNYTFGFSLTLTEFDSPITGSASRRLAAQTIAAGTGKLRTGAYFTNITDTPTSDQMLSLYVWRPSTSSVVGFLYDSHTTLGTQRVNVSPENYQAPTFSIASVTTQKDDVIIAEYWHHATRIGTSTTTSIGFGQIGVDLGSWVEFAIGPSLATTVTATSSVTANLTVQGPLVTLAATPAAVSSLTAAMKVARGLAATSAAVSSATASLAVARALQTTVSAVSTQTATLSVSLKFVAIAAAVSTVSANLTVQVPVISLASVVATASAATAAISVKRGIAALSIAVSTAAAAISVTRGLSTLAAAQSSVNAAIAVARALQTQIAGVAQATAAMRVTYALRAVSAAISSIAASLSVQLGTVASDIYAFTSVIADPVVSKNVIANPSVEGLRPLGHVI